MTLQDKPADELKCAIVVTVLENYTLPPEAGWKSWLKNIFNDRQPRGAMIGGCNIIFNAIIEQDMDYSAIGGVVAQVAELRNKAEAERTRYLAANKRQACYVYKDCIDAHVLIGRPDQFRRDLIFPERIIVRDVAQLRDADITSANIAGVLAKFDTAEARQKVIDAAVSQAIAPATGVKPMKTLKVKRPA